MQRLLGHVLLFCCIVLPTGSIYNINVKIFILAMLVFSFLLYGRIKKQEIYLFCIFVASLLFFSLMGFLKGNDSRFVIQEFTSIFTVSLIILVFNNIVSAKIITSQEIIKSIVYISLFHAIERVLAQSFILVGIFTLEEYIVFIEGIFNYRLINLDTDFIPRINSSNDFILPIALYVLLQSRFNGDFMLLKNKYLTDIAVFLLLICIVGTYSRFLWFFAIVVVLFAYIRCNLPASRKITVLSIIAAILVFFLGENFITIFQERFFGEAASQSDSLRILMFDALVPAVFNNPIFGEGLGYYNPHYYRFEEMRWSYELQWLSLTAQTGIIGVLAYIIYLYKVTGFLHIKNIKNSYALFIFMAIWLSSGFFNNFLLTSFSAVMYVFIKELVSNEREVKYFEFKS